MYRGVGGRAAFARRRATYFDQERPDPVEVDPEAGRALGDKLRRQWIRLAQDQFAFSQTLREFELAGAYVLDEHLTTASWLRHQLHLTHAQAAQQVTVARQLEQLPLTAEALEQGEISYQHSAVLASSARKLGAEVVQPQEATLVKAAKQVDPFRLGLLVQHLEHAVDPDGSLSWFEAQQERRRLELSRTSDGMWALRGLFDAEGGAVIASGLEKLMPVPLPDDRRPVWQRRADALVESFREGAERPQLTVLSELGTLKGLPGSPGGELRDSLLIPAPAVQRLACDAVVQEAHLHEDGIQVDLSEQRRTVPARLRRKLELRDGGCRFPRLRPAAPLDRRPPPPALAGRRPDRARKPGPALPPPPRQGPRGRLVPQLGCSRRAPRRASLAGALHVVVVEREVRMPPAEEPLLHLEEGVQQPLDLAGVVHRLAAGRRQLLQSARDVVAEIGGNFPDAVAVQLLQLPEDPVGRSEHPLKGVPAAVLSFDLFLELFDPLVGAIDHLSPTLPKAL